MEKAGGNRKYAHLNDQSDSEKSKIIREIQSEGLDPIIKVIASNLTEQEAFLIEKLLFGDSEIIFQISRPVIFSEKFRPHNTLHKNLPLFDFENQIMYVNVGEGPTRTWEDCREYGFMAAGQGVKYRDSIKRLNRGIL